MLTEQLRKIGFNEGEAKVYLAALELGETSVARIAQKAKLERTTVYGFLENLKKRGLISISKHRNKTVYSAENPKKLKREIEEKGKYVEAILPELLSITNAIDNKPTVKFYDSREGIYDIYRDTLLYEGEKIQMWMSSPWYDDEKFWRDIYMPERIEKKILIKAIVPKTDEAVEFVKDDKVSLRETRMTDSHNITADIVLYGKRNVAIISYKDMTGLVLENDSLFQTLQAIFESHWISISTKIQPTTN